MAESVDLLRCDMDEFKGLALTPINQLHVVALFA